MVQPYPIPRGIRQAGPYDFDGTSTVYGPFGAPSQFSIFDAVDVIVEVRTSSTGDWAEVEATVEKTSTAPLSSFTIDFGEVYPATHDFRFYGRRTHERSLDVTKGTSLSADKLELELSKMAAVLQEIRRDVDSPTTTVLDQVRVAQAAAAAAAADRAISQQAATEAAEHAAAASLWDPSSYSTTDEIDAKLEDYAPADREIAGVGCVKVNGGASATLATDLSLSLTFASEEQAIAGEVAGVPIDPLTLAAVLDAQVSNVPVGAVMGFDLDAPPAGWLAANGAAVNRLIYTALDAARYCGDANNGTATAWYRCTDPANPSTSRSTTGNYLVTRDYRGVFPRFLDGGRGLDSGRVLGSYQADAFAAHSVTIPTSSLSGSGPSGVIMGSGSGPGTFGVNITGGSETRSKNMALLGCIKF